MRMIVGNCIMVCDLYMWSIRVALPSVPSRDHFVAADAKKSIDFVASFCGLVFLAATGC